MKPDFNARKLPAIIFLAISMHFFLMAVWFLPMYLIQPAGIRSFIYHISNTIASTFVNLSELTLTIGATCTTDRSYCKESFIFEGDIQPGDATLFAQKLSAAAALRPDIRLICLNSKGGYNNEAAAIARTIKALGLDTCVGDMPLSTVEYSEARLRFTSACESACVMILLSGKNRIAIGERFKIGVHSNKAVFELTQAGDERPNAPNQASSSGGAYTSDFAWEDLRRQYDGALWVTDQEFEALNFESARTPGSRMYYLTLDEAMGLHLFNVRLPVAQ